MAMALPDDGPPRLVLGPSGTLRALAKGDTLEVQRTGGHYDHGAERFEGRSGRVDWGRSGWNPERNYADFDAFSIRLKTPSLTVDSARFTTELFPDPLLGQLTDKARPASGTRRRGRRWMRRAIHASTPTSTGCPCRTLCPGWISRAVDGAGCRAAGQGHRGGTGRAGFPPGGQRPGEAPGELVHPQGPARRAGVDIVHQSGQRSSPGVEPSIRSGQPAPFACSDRGGVGPAAFLRLLPQGLAGLRCAVLEMDENRLRLEGPPGSSRSTAILFSEDFSTRCLPGHAGHRPIHPITRVYNHIRATGDTTFSSQQLASSIRLTEPKTRP